MKWGGRTSPLWCLLPLGCVQTLDPGSDPTAAGDGPRPAVDAPAIGDIACVTGCAALQSSLDHCGRCDNPCVVGREICLFGACSPCLVGINCDNTCVHPYTDPMHCGNCTTRCAAGKSCITG